MFFRSLVLTASCIIKIIIDFQSNNNNDVSLLWKIVQYKTKQAAACSMARASNFQVCPNNYKLPFRIDSWHARVSTILTCARRARKFLHFYLKNWNFDRDLTAISGILTAIWPRYRELWPRYDRDIGNFDRDLTAISSRKLVAVPRYREPMTANYPCVCYRTVHI